MNVRHTTKEITFNEIISLENILTAWGEFRHGKNGKEDVMAFGRNIEENIFRTHWELQNDFYRHAPYASFVIHDPKRREIHKATVKDRVIHHAIFRVLYPAYDRTFIDDSYSCRVDKGSHKAVNRLALFLKNTSRNFTQPCFALKCDIKQFFASIDHEILLTMVKRRIADQRTIRLLEIIIGSFKTGKSERERERVKGLPIGNLTSQLFANIYMDQLDRFMKHELKVKQYIRYSDDFIIVHREKTYLESLIPIISSFLHDNLALTLHPKKVILRKFSQGIDFLGYVVLPHHRVLRTKTRKRMFRLFEEKTWLEYKEIITHDSLNQSLQSYMGMIKHCDGHRVKRKLRHMLKI